MQVPPTAALLHALSRIGDVSVANAPRTTAAAGQVRAVATPDAARAAAKAAFEAVRAAQPPAAAVAQPPPADSAPPSKPMPRGSFLNLVV